jgi:hypothetical protein
MGGGVDEAGPDNEQVPTRPRTPPGVGTPLRAGGHLLAVTRVI